MTYQKPHDDDVKVEEATSLLSGQGGGGVPAGTKKNGVPTMRAMIVTTASVFLGTLAVVIYGGRGGSSHTSSGGISIKPSPTSTTSYTTRYWDCEGGACGCGYQETANVKPTMCPSNAMVKAPLNNKYGAKFYGTAAVNQSLFGNGSWQGRGCGKCYKLTGTSNVDTDRVTSTIILKATNLCPECAGDHYFDIAAPGFDTSSSGQNHCKDSALDNNHGACSNWMGPKGSMNPSKDCDCNKIQDPTLRKGCENFLSLKWNNPYVQFEQVDCPPELGSKHPPCNTSGRWDIGLHGTCASSSPVVPKRECANIGDDVYDPNKFSKVPASCCTGKAVFQDGKYLCL